ncbi:MAG: Fic family protein [Planctomycetia bacterium]|nr:Fic family protein [Planctomycetia bacterium]
MESLGYQYLVERYALSVPSLYKKSYLSATTRQSKEISADGEEEYFPSSFEKVPRTWQGQLHFAMKHEGVNLAVLNSLFQKLPLDELAQFILEKPTGRYRRRLWFFYEFLMRKELPVPPLNRGSYIFAMEPDEYFTLEPGLGQSETRSRRQRVINNLIGTRDFCPIIRKTKKVREFQKINFTARVKQIEAEYPDDLLAGATEYLCMKETKSSFAIERLTPDQRRMARFVDLLKRRGNSSITKEFLIRIQNEIVDDRYRDSNYRTTQVYVGQSLTPLEERIHYIAPRPEELDSLMAAFLVMTNNLLKTASDPVLSAVLVSFAFVFLHPFDDGNGRLHRYLLHYVLSQRCFIPEGIIFPFSSQFHNDPARYDRMLESVSKPLLPLIEYQLDRSGRMTVTNDTSDYYRFLNMTEIAELFYETLLKVIDEDFTHELKFLQANRQAKREMQAVVDLPDKRMRLFIQFVLQNGGEFPKARRKQFDELTDREIAALAQVVRNRLCEFK